MQETALFINDTESLRFLPSIFVWFCSRSKIEGGE